MSACSSAPVKSFSIWPRFMRRRKKSAHRNSLNGVTSLEAAGWHATIAGNRITVNYEVFAQFIAASVGQFGHVDASWVIYTAAGSRPVWIVGAEPV